jgi:hypothetical protein
VVPLASARVLRARTYSGADCLTVPTGYATITRSGAAFQAASPHRLGVVGAGRLPGLSYNPASATVAPWHRCGLGNHPVRSPLLRVSFSLPPATEMFQFTGCPPSCDGTAEAVGCPIRRSADHSLLATPRSFSERCPVLPRHAAPWHPSCAHGVFPAHWSTVGQRQRISQSEQYATW